MNVFQEMDDPVQFNIKKYTKYLDSSICLIALQKLKVDENKNMQQKSLPDHRFIKQKSMNIYAAQAFNKCK